MTTLSDPARPTVPGTAARAESPADRRRFPDSTANETASDFRTIRSSTLASSTPGFSTHTSNSKALPD